jgi:hypothetical protein
LKEWECVQVDSHKDIGRTIEQWQRNGWRLNTYQAAGMGAGPMAYKVNHYLLFERENDKKMPTSAKAAAAAAAAAAT